MPPRRSNRLLEQFEEAAFEEEQEVAAVRGRGARGATARGRGAVARGCGGAARARGAGAPVRGAAARGRGARGRDARGARGRGARGRGARGRGRGVAQDEDPEQEDQEEEEQYDEKEQYNEEEELPPPPNLAEVMAAQTQLMRQLAQFNMRERNRRAPEGGRAEPYHQTPEGRMSAFMKYHPPTFDSSDDPLVADAWIREIEKKLNILQCDDAESIRLATHQLVGAADAWWNSFSENHPDIDSLTWEEFVTEFRDYHIAEGAMEVKAEEFRNLRQGNMSVSEYVNKFTQLSRYTPEEVATEKRKIYWFKRGLHAGMIPHLVAGEYPTLKKLINKCYQVETARKKVESVRLGKRKAMDQGQRAGGSQKPRFSGPSQQRVGRPPQGKPSGFTPRPYSQGTSQGQLQQSGGKQQFSGGQYTTRCFACGKEGHKSYQCPNKQQVSGNPQKGNGNTSTPARPQFQSAQRQGQSAAKTQGQQSASRSRLNHISVEEAQTASDVVLDKSVYDDTAPNLHEDLDLDWDPNFPESEPSYDFTEQDFEEGDPDQDE